MHINHNIPALRAHGNLEKVNILNSNVITRLSSGLRINSAADDAAGLAISEKMRSQVKGTYKAIRNVQNGISLVQTADGGLNEVHSLLQRMRELTLQASNGTLTTEDKNNIQKEINQLTGEIDNIANNTEYNTRKVLRPPIDQEPAPANGKADIVFVVDNTGSMASIQTEIANKLTNFIDSISNKGVNDLRMGLVEYTDSTNDPKDFSGSKWTTDKEDIKQGLLDLAVSNTGGTENTFGVVEDTIDTYDFRNNESGAQIKHIIFVTNEPGDDPSNLTSTTNKANSEGVEVHGVFDTTDPASTELNQLVNNTNGKKVNINTSNWSDQLSDVLGSHIGESGEITEEDEVPTLILQTGPNENQTMSFKTSDVRSIILGIENIKIDPPSEAEKSLTKIDQTIEEVSKERARYGSIQNRLEHITNNLQNSFENLQSSHSRILDADMAKETMKMTKNQILQQTAQSMLAQANQLPKNFMNFD